MAPWLPLLAAAVIALPVAQLVNSVVPDAYMDEVFHIPQAQCYCQWDFKTWDPMITTFPGLYLLSLPYEIMFLPWTRLIMPAMSSLRDICTPKMLRSINIFLSLVCLLLLRSILIQLDPRKREGAASVKSLVLALFPLHWFFTFLYYTDVGSTTAVMAMYLACLKRSYWLSALLSVVAIFFRQTNAVWTVFVLCVGFIQYLQDQQLVLNEYEPGIKEVDTSETSVTYTTRKMLRNRANSRGNARLSNNSPKRISGKQNAILALLLEAWRMRWGVVTTFLPFLLVIAAFIMFIFYNGSIVVGAKDAHKVSPHFAQPFYFALFTAGALAPYHFWLDRLLDFRSVLRRRPLLSSIIALASMTIALFAVHFFSLAHPYLLADNRHYTFYIWKDIIQAHWTAKYLLAPIYIYSWWSIIQCLLEKSIPTESRNRKILQVIWVICFCGATVAVLVPAPLVEFRYYTVPFYIFALHMLADVETSSWKLWFIAAAFVVVNAFTMRMFLFRPFTWPHEVGTQRFIW